MGRVVAAAAVTVGVAGGVLSGCGSGSPFDPPRADLSRVATLLSDPFVLSLAKGVDAHGDAAGLEGALERAREGAAAGDPERMALELAECERLLRLHDYGVAAGAAPAADAVSISALHVVVLRAVQLSTPAGAAAGRTGGEV